MYFVRKNFRLKGLDFRVHYNIISRMNFEFIELP